ncbi:MAG: ISKra4 family transposase [Planctomycetota bacterium]
MSANRSRKSIPSRTDTDPSTAAKGIPGARAFFEQLVKKVMEGSAGKPLHEVERGMLAQLLELGRLVLGGFLETQVEAPAKTIHRHGLDVPFHCRKRTTYFSMFGVLEIWRPYYWSEASKGGIHPLDAELNLPARRYSYFLQEIAALFAVRGSYDKVTETLEKLFGVTLWKQGAELVVGDTGELVQEYYETRRGRFASDGPVLVVSADGKGIPMRKPEKVEKTLRRSGGMRRNKKQMSVVTAVYTADPRPRTAEQVTASLFGDEGVDRRLDPVEPRNKRVRAWLGPAEDAFDELERHVHERRPDAKSDRVLLIDGEKRMIDKAALPQFDGWTKILDVVHAIQRIWDVGVLVLGEGNAKDWVRKRVLLLLKGRVDDLAAEVDALAARAGGARRKAFKVVSRYFRANRDRMRYDEYLSRGLPIATGVVEGACCTLVKQRMEGPGMRWSVEGAHAVLEMRALDQNDDWKAFWRWFPAVERLRLYGRPQKLAG